MVEQPGRRRAEEGSQNTEEKPQRPTLAKDALEWGTLKFLYARMHRWATAGPVLQHRKRPLNYGLRRVSRQSKSQESGREPSPNPRGSSMYVMDVWTYGQIGLMVEAA